jgi:hypothetical protein
MNWIYVNGALVNLDKLVCIHGTEQDEIYSLNFVFEDGTQTSSSCPSKEKAQETFTRIRRLLNAKNFMADTTSDSG